MRRCGWLFALTVSSLCVEATTLKRATSGLLWSLKERRRACRLGVDVEVKEVEGKGMGLFALRDIDAGEVR